MCCARLSLEVNAGELLTVFHTRHHSNAQVWEVTSQLYGLLTSVLDIDGPGVAQWLRHCATSRAVPGSNPGGVGHRDFSRGYRQNHVPWGQLSL